MARAETDMVCFFVLRFRSEKQENFYISNFPFSFPGTFHCSVLPPGTADTTPSGNKAQIKTTLKVPNMKRTLTLPIFPFSPDQADAIASTSEEMIPQ